MGLVANDEGAREVSLYYLLRVERLSEPVVVPVWLSVMGNERHHEREVVDERQQDRLDDVLHAPVVGKGTAALTSTRESRPSSSTNTASGCTAPRFSSPSPYRYGIFV